MSSVFPHQVQSFNQIQGAVVHPGLSDVAAPWNSAPSSGGVTGQEDEEVIALEQSSSSGRSSPTDSTPFSPSVETRFTLLSIRPEPSEPNKGF